MTRPIFSPHAQVPASPAAVEKAPRHCTCLQTPAARRGRGTVEGEEGARRPGAGGPPLPARGPRSEAGEDARRARKLCPSPQGSSPRTCSPVCPIPARGGRDEG